MTAPRSGNTQTTQLEADLLAAFERGDMITALTVLSQLTEVDTDRARYLLRLIASVTDIVNQLTKEGRL
jgi:hypothetical protein